MNGTFPVDIDVMNRVARIRRMGLAVSLGTFAMSIAVFVAVYGVRPGSIPHDGGIGMQNQHFYNAWQFIFFVGAMIGMLVGGATYAIHKRRSR